MDEESQGSLSGQGNEPGRGDRLDRGQAVATSGPGELLTEMRLLRRRTRSARHAYWFPLVLFGLLICASAPFYLQPYPSPGYASGSGQGLAAGSPSFFILSGATGSIANSYLPYYWLTSLSTGLLLTLLWYRRHARRVGLETPARGYVITGAVITALAFILPTLSGLPALSWLQVLWPSDLTVRGMFPFLIIAVALCVLAWAERSRALVVIAAVYTGISLLVSMYDIENVLQRLGWTTDGRLSALPSVLLPALLLLAAGAGAFAVQRRHRGAA